MRTVILIILLVAVLRVDSGFFEDILLKPINKFYNMTEKIHKAKIDAISRLDEKLGRATSHITNLFDGHSKTIKEKKEEQGGDVYHSEKIVLEDPVASLDVNCPEGSPGALNGSCLPDIYVRYNDDIGDKE
ncbi:unnamed protein product [Pieris brassicae]|uniref:Uncharacterized protein n=1 Tax=Pieris brassicae TaxID=7116 RepID=A0A9P0XAM4_PIEBR|nr:unnamed protein product [Pieris brassicae]